MWNLRRPAQGLRKASRRHCARVCVQWCGNVCRLPQDLAEPTDRLHVFPVAGTRGKSPATVRTCVYTGFELGFCVNTHRGSYLIGRYTVLNKTTLFSQYQNTLNYSTRR